MRRHFWLTTLMLLPGCIDKSDSAKVLEENAPDGHYIIVGPQETLLKKRIDKDSSELEARSEKCELKAGETVLIQSAPELEQKHYLVNTRAVRPNCSFSKGYVFASHVSRSSLDRDWKSLESHDTMATLYTIENTEMEGGPKDRCNRLLGTLKDYLNGDASTVGIAMDTYAFPYGTKIRIPEIEEKLNGGRYIDFRIVDTGDAFVGKGNDRIDICVGHTQDDIYSSRFSWISKRTFKFHVIEKGPVPPPYCR